MGLFLCKRTCLLIPTRSAVPALTGQSRRLGQSASRFRSRRSQHCIHCPSEGAAESSFTCDTGGLHHLVDSSRILGNFVFDAHSQHPQSCVSSQISTLLSTVLVFSFFYNFSTYFFSAVPCSPPYVFVSKSHLRGGLARPKCCCIRGVQIVA